MEMVTQSSTRGHAGAECGAIDIWIAAILNYSLELSAGEYADFELTFRICADTAHDLEKTRGNNGCAERLCCWHGFCSAFLVEKGASKIMEPDLFEDDEMDEFNRRRNMPARKKKERGKKAGKQLLSEVKTRMVMRIYGLSRAHAAKFIAGREQELGAEAAKKANEKPAEEFPGVQDLFGSR
jgi:hypothetical protein